MRRRSAAAPATKPDSNTKPAWPRVGTAWAVAPAGGVVAAVTLIVTVTGAESTNGAALVLPPLTRAALLLSELAMVREIGYQEAERLLDGAVMTGACE